MDFGGPQAGGMGAGGGGGSTPMSTSRIASEDLNRLIEEVQQGVATGDDGSFRGLWILTMIDHWNNDHEKVLVLMDATLYILKYDFMAKKLKDTKRIPLSSVTKLQTGYISYPAKSLMPPRNQVGIRVNWGEVEEVSMVQKWNPLCKTIPFATLVHHPLNKKTGAPSDQEANTTYNVDNFCDALKDALKNYSTEIKNEEILIETYGNVTSVVFNQVNLGFSKDVKNGTT